MIFHLVSPIKTPFTEKKKENSSHRSLSRWTIATSDSDGFSKCAFRIPRIKRWRPQRGAYVPWRASAPAGGYALGHKQNMRWNSYTRHTRKFGGKTARASLRLPLLLENFPFSIPRRMCAFRFGGGWLWLFLVLIVFKFYLRDFWSGSDQRNFIKLIFFFIHSDCEFNWKYYNFGTVHFWNIWKYSTNYETGFCTYLDCYLKDQSMTSSHDLSRLILTVIIIILHYRFGTIIVYLCWLYVTRFCTSIVSTKMFECIFQPPSRIPNGCNRNRQI